MGYEYMIRDELSEYILVSAALQMDFPRRSWRTCWKIPCDDFEFKDIEGR